MDWLTQPFTQDEIDRRDAEKRKHEQGLCHQDACLCHWCWMEEHAGPKDPAYEQAIRDYFGR